MNINNISRKDKVNILLFKLLLIVQYGFFLLIPIPQVSRGLAYTPWASLLLILIMWINSLGKTDELGILVYFFILINLVSFVYIFLHYKYLDSTAYTGLGYALLTLIYFPLKRISGKFDIKHIIIFTNILAILIILVQVVYFNVFGSTLISSFDPTKLQIRNGLRITYYDYLVLTNVAISVGILFRKRNLLDSVNLLLSYIYIFYVSQTRYIEAVALVIVGIVGIAYVWKFLKKGYVTAISVSIIFVILPVLFIAIRKIYTALIQPILDGSYMSIGSYFARLGELDFYSNVLKNNFIFGLGNFSTQVSSPYWTTIHGPEGIFYTQDLGLFGDVVRLGSLMLILFILLVLILNKKNYKDFGNLPLKLIIYSSVGSISVFSNGFILGLILALITNSRKSRRNYLNDN